MGYYINPKSMTKEQFLVRHGEPIPQPSAWDFESDSLCVVLVDNGPFTAAGIAVDQRELDAFRHPDERPKWWYSVKRADLAPYLPKQRAAT